jgi:hypothetical protein
VDSVNQTLQDLRLLFSHLASLHLQQPQKLDAERLEKLHVHCKTKLGALYGGARLDSGNSVTEEFDIGMVEVANLKHTELNAVLAVTPAQGQPLVQQQIARLLQLLTQMKNHESL